MQSENLVDESRAARRVFVRRLMMFWLPIALVFLPVIGVLEMALWKSGETWPIARVIAVQKAHPGAIFGRAFLDQAFYRYKYLNVLDRRAPILAVGSSRVMEFRPAMFGAQSSGFYNAGGMVQNVFDLDAFATQLPPEATPRVMLLGIDMWWLNANYRAGNVEGFSHGIAQEDAFDWRGHWTLLRVCLRKKKWRTYLREAAARAPFERIGLRTHDKNGGFRFDGSMDNNLSIPRDKAGWQFRDRGDVPVVARIEKGANRFEFTDGISPRHFAALRSALQKFKARNILVVAFLPPITDEAAAMMQKNPRQSALWQQYRRDVPALCEELGFPCVDASTPAKLGLDNRSMLDGMHGLETFHLHLLQRMTKDQRVRAALPDVENVANRALKSPRTNFWFPDYNAK